MKKLLFILTLTTVSMRMTAEAWPYTVMAPSGIFLRAEPSKTSKRLLSLPFGSRVYETEYSDSYYQFTDIDTTVIEGIRGHWIRVKSNSTVGYVFSGYVLAGEWIIKSEGTINKEYQLLRAGNQWTGIVYDPKLNWYVFDQNEKSPILKRVNITIQTWQAYPEHEYDHYENPFKILVDGRDTICWLLGSKEILPETASTILLPSSNPNARDYYNDSGMFLYPEQKISFLFQSTEFQLAGKEAIILDKSLEEGYRREYNLHYKRIDHLYPHLQGTYEYDLSKELRLEGTAANQSQFHSPSIQWVGDLNGDQELDFIVLTRPVYESHESSDSYSLFISDKTSGQWIRLAAIYVIYYFDNC